jgi:5,10-methylenetetrahydrofolate reductase
MFENAKEEAGRKDNPQLVFGYFPITKLRTAQFLSAHVPGVNVPKTFMDTLYEAKKVSDESQEKVGFDLSVKLFNEIHEIHPKMHIMAANNFGLVKRILEAR